jgi:hypothetical protein
VQLIKKTTSAVAAALPGTRGACCPRLWRQELVVRCCGVTLGVEQHRPSPSAVAGHATGGNGGRMTWNMPPLGRPHRASHLLPVGAAVACSRYWFQRASLSQSNYADSEARICRKKSTLIAMIPARFYQWTHCSVHEIDHRRSVLKYCETTLHYTSHCSVRMNT